MAVSFSGRTALLIIASSARPDGRVRRRDLQHFLDRLLSILCGADFHRPARTLLAYGIAVTFLSAAIGGTIVALRSSLPFAVAGPDSSISVVIAAMVATVVQRLAARGGTIFLLPTLIAMSLATALTGFLLCVLGFTHAGRAIRFVPFPVIGGFLGATGWLMITGAMQVVSDQRPVLANLGAFMNVAIAPSLLLRRSSPSRCIWCFVVPRARSPCPAFFDGVRRDISSAVVDRLIAGRGANYGWMFRPQPVAGLISPWHSEHFTVFPGRKCRRSLAMSRRHVRHHHQLSSQHDRH